MARIISLLILLAIASGCSGLAVDRSIRLAPAWWPASGGDRETEESITPPLTQAWTFNAVAGFGPGSPLIAGDVVIVANRKGELYILRHDNGKRAGTRRLGEAIEGSPTLVNEVLYVPISWGGKAVLAYDIRTDRRLWLLKGAPVEGSLLVAGGDVVAADIQGVVHVLRATDGGKRWERALTGTASFRCAPVQVSREMLVVADDHGTITALRTADGETLWQAETGLPVYTTPLVQDSTLIVSTTRGRLLALDALTGRERWRLSLPDSTIRMTAAAASDGSIVVADGSGALRALNAVTGAVRWTFQVQAPFIAAPAVSGGIVYAGGTDAHLYAVDLQTGSVRWKEKLKGRIKSAPAVGNGSVVVLAEPNLVYAYRKQP